ncbi:MAG: glycosyltransferase [Aquabacterium sp.]
MNPFASIAPQPLRVALIDAVRPHGMKGETFCPDTGPHAVEMLACALARRGHAVDIYRGRDAGEPIWEDLQAGVRIHRVATTAPWPHDEDQTGLTQAVQAFVAGMRHMARDVYPCDVVHAFGLHAGLVGLRLTRGMSVPFILNLQPALAGDEHIGALEELLVRRSDGLVASSERQRDALMALPAASRAAVHLVPRGVDTQRFRPGRKARLRDMLGWPQEAFIVMWGGSPESDLSRLRDGLPVFRAASRIGAHVVALGADSPWPGEMAGLPQVSVVDLEAVEGSARQAHLSACYAASDVLVLPSWHREVEAICGREAMACGTPVMVLSQHGSDEATRAVEDGVTGYVLHRPTPEAILQRLRILSEQPRRREAMGMAAVLRARTFHTWHKVAERLASVYAHARASQHEVDVHRSFTLIRNSRPRLVSTLAPLVPTGA